MCEMDSQNKPKIENFKIALTLSDGGGACCGPERCTVSRAKSCMKTFFAHLFSHAGLCALVVGYAVMGAFIFTHLEKDNELATRKRVGDDRMNTLNELYNITGESELLRVSPKSRITALNLGKLRLPSVRLVEKGEKSV